MKIDLIFLAGLIGTISAISAPIIWIIKLYNKVIKRMEILEFWNKEQQADINKISKELNVITFGLLSSLKGLEEHGCNGPVKEGISKIETFLSDSVNTPNSEKR
ncbi:MAG: branched-chain amino acid ABC transporter permease [Clostridiales bacterium]|jgi:predicted transcriptional regulator|nr:branched-chain amino acid ABC transporter permease [Clostridiales bacterium]